MKTNFGFSSKMHLFIIVSSLVIAIGMAVGIICQFVAGGFFNYGADWADYKEVTITYEYVEYGSKDKVVEICDEAFAAAGVKSFAKDVHGSTNTGGEITYKFTLSTDIGELRGAVTAINNAIKAGIEDGTLVLSNGAAYVGNTIKGGSTALTRMSIALAVVIVFHFVYFAIRYKLSMAIAAVIADVHNLALFIALLAITRVPLGSTMFAFAAITVVVTVLCTCFAFDRMRKNLKDDSINKLSIGEQVDAGANQSFMVNILVPACLAVAAVLMFALLSISSLSPLAVISPVMCALVGFVACAYGNTFFTPAVYCGIRSLEDKMTTTQKGPSKDSQGK